MKDEPVAKVLVKPIIQKSKPNMESKPRNEEENRESFKIASPPNPKVTKIQEKNINDNYGRIYIQEGQKRNPNYIKSPQKESKYRGYQNKNPPKTNTYTKVNNAPNNNYNNKYSDRVDITKLTFGKEKDNGKSKNNNLKRKSIDRGDNKNVKITHIINSSMEIDFHMTDPLDITTEESRRKYRGSIDKKNRNGRNGSVKVTYSCSCENVKILPKKKNRGKSEVVSHRDNPHLKRNVNNINMINNNNNKNYREYNNIKMSNVKGNYQGNNNQRKKY